MAQLLNNMNVWMVLYCAKQLLGWKKNLESKLKSIESKLKSIESKLTSIKNKYISKKIVEGGRKKNCQLFSRLKLFRGGGGGPSH